MNGTFRHRVRVYWEDTDGGGIVYYANYLRFFERARTELLRSRGYSQSEMQGGDNLVFAVISVSVDYLRPARLDDLLEVSVRVAQASRVSLTFEQEITRDNDADEVLCRATVRVACLDATKLTPRRIPVAILEELH